jgi:hypothetical protein
MQLRRGWLAPNFRYVVGNCGKLACILAQTTRALNHSHAGLGVV